MNITMENDSPSKSIMSRIKTGLIALITVGIIFSAGCSNANRSETKQDLQQECKQSENPKTENVNADDEEESKSSHGGILDCISIFDLLYFF